MNERRRGRAPLSGPRLVGVATLLTTVCLLNAVAAPLQSAASKTSKKIQIKKYESRVPFAQQFARAGNVCIQFGGSISAGAFFENLQGRVSPKGVEYWNDGHPVELFPPTLSVLVVAIPRMCNRQPWEDLEPGARDLMEGFQFEVDWKTGTKMAKSDAFNLVKPQHDLEELPLLGPGALADVWKYQMTVNGEHVPLSAHLIISIFDEQRKLIVRLSASL